MSAKIRDYEEHPGAQAVNQDPRLWSKAALGERPDKDEDDHPAPKHDLQ